MSDLRIFGDWGSTRLRLWLLREGEVVDHCDGPGVVGLGRPSAEVLLETISAWRRRGPIDRIVLCGMAGARGALVEAPYMECPAELRDWGGAAVNLTLDGLCVRIAAGCANGDVDVMRGEETQVFGAFAIRPDLAGEDRHIILPGTHSKWVSTSGGAIVNLRTFLTGELFALLQSSSLLAAKGAASDGEGDGFVEGVALSRRSSGLLGDLFSVRAAQLRRGRSAAWAGAFLSGLLIGSEIAEMQQAGPLPGSVVLIGDSKLTARYRRALETFELSCHVVDGEACAIAGLRLLDGMP